MLIGLTGLAGSGKDTAGLVLFLSQDFVRMAFADPVKETAAAMFGEDVGDFHDPALKNEMVYRWDMTRRQMMQHVGEMVKADRGQDFWIKHWFFNYLQIAENHNVVVTDVRYDHEAKAIIDRGGYILAIVRPGAGLQGEEATHVSERGILPQYITAYVNNDGSKVDLGQRIAAALKELRAAL